MMVALKKMKELEYYFEALFQESNLYIKIRYILLVLTITFLSVSIFVDGYILYISTFFALIFQSFSWCLKYKIGNIRDIANEFHKISMLTSAYGYIPCEFQLSHLKTSVSNNVFCEVKEKTKNDAKGTEYYLNNLNNPREKLLSMIHENCYWNFHLFRTVFRHLIFGISLTIIVLITLVVILAIPLTKSDPEYTILRLAFIFLSFSLFYEVIERAVYSHRSSRIMLEIDNELTRSKEKITELQLLKIFNQYCDAKESAPNVPFFIYSSNKHRLNSGWENRVDMNKTAFFK
ncbi:MAG TPA: hypothetical protein DEF07_07415 [Nitrosomonas sp.]|nr:hypothetical protein [Nitrosomonas sp.]